MRLSAALAVPVAVALSASACSTGAPPGSATPVFSMSPITHEEIETAIAGNAYDAVRLLRPRWLRPRMTSGVGEAYPMVYMRGQRYGAIGWLQTIRCENVREIRYVNARDATTRWGMGHSAGVIEVVPLI